MSFRRDLITKPIYQSVQLVLQPSTASEAVARVVEVDDFAPEALSPIYKKPAEVHQFFQELGEQRAAN
jgi:acyl-CoA dehydrogenase